MLTICGIATLRLQLSYVLLVYQNAVTSIVCVFIVHTMFTVPTIPTLEYITSLTVLNSVYRPCS